MASRDQDKPAAELLRRSLASSSGAADACPEPEILAAYFERSLDAEELARYELHFSECGRCREQLAAMARAEEPAANKQLGRTPSWSWLWDWRRLVPALAALVIVAAIWRVERPAQPPLVAMSRQAESPTMTTAPESSREREVPAPITPSAPAPAANAIRRLVPSTQNNPALQKSATDADNKTSLPNPPQNIRDYAQANASSESGKRPAPAATELAENTPLSGGAPATAEATASSAAVASAAQPQPAAPEASNSDKKDLSLPNAPAARSGFGMNKQMAGALVAPQASPQNEAKAVDAISQRPSQPLIRTPDPRILWRIAEAGFVERSTDSGATWKGQLPNQDAEYLAGAAPTSTICWLVGSGGIILVSTDAANWQTVPPPAPADFVAITAKDASSATVTAADGRKFTTVDRGKHWNPAPQN